MHATAEHGERPTVDPDTHVPRECAGDGTDAGRSLAAGSKQQEPCPRRIVVAVIRLPEIEEIFTVLDRRGISREAVVIPLTKRDPGSVRLLPNQKLEIVAPESQPVGTWLPELERHIDAVMNDDSSTSE
jgi:hypothetical protein